MPWGENSSWGESLGSHFGGLSIHEGGESLEPLPEDLAGEEIASAPSAVDGRGGEKKTPFELSAVDGCGGEHKKPFENDGRGADIATDTSSSEPRSRYAMFSQVRALRRGWKDK